MWVRVGAVLLHIAHGVLLTDEAEGLRSGAITCSSKIMGFMIVYEMVRVI